MAKQSWAAEKVNIVKWQPFAAIAATIVIFFSAQLIGGFIVTLYPALRGWTAQDIGAWFETSVLAQFILVFMVEAITIWFLWLLLKRRKNDFKTLGLNKPQLKHFFYAGGAFLLYIPILIVVFQIAQLLIPGLNLEQEQQVGFQAAHGGALILVGLSLVILPAVTEELLVRGYLYHRLKTNWPKWLAALATSLLFALAHLQFGSAAPLLWPAAIDTFILSLVLIVLLEKSGSLWACIWLHMLKNGLAFLTLFIFN